MALLNYSLIIISSVLIALGWCYAACCIVYNRWYKKPAIVFSAILSLIQLTIPQWIYTAMYESGNMTVEGVYMLEGANFLLHALILVCLLKRMQGGNIWQLVSAVCFCYVCFYVAYSLVEYIITEWILAFEQPTQWQLILLTIVPHALGGGSAALTGWLMRRANFRVLFDIIYSKPAAKVAVTIGCVLLMNTYRVLWVLFGQSITMAYGIACLVLMAALVALLAVAAGVNATRLRLSTQQAIIQQQREYVLSLERIQSEVRAFSHDYQNMLSGLFLQAEQGDIQGLQSFLREKLDYFSDRLGDEIKTTSQLANIQMMELKSLLIYKLAAMREAGIEYNLEIINPVVTIAMDNQDLLRCLGVLLDNAIEAAAQAEWKHVSVIILAEERQATFIVKNTFATPPDLSAMWQSGWSTKGKGRGTGLAGYQRIVSGYDNVACRTACENGLLTQELKVRDAS